MVDSRSQRKVNLKENAYGRQSKRWLLTLGATPGRDTRVPGAAADGPPVLRPAVEGCPTNGRAHGRTRGGPLPWSRVFSSASSTGAAARPLPTAGPSPPSLWSPSHWRDEPAAPSPPPQEGLSTQSDRTPIQRRAPVRNDGQRQLRVVAVFPKPPPVRTARQPFSAQLKGPPGLAPHRRAAPDGHFVPALSRAG